MKFEQKNFKNRTVFTSFWTSSLSVLLLSLYLYVILNPTDDELRKIAIVVCFLFPGMLGFYLFFLFRFISPIERGIEEIPDSEVEQKKLYVNIITFPLKATVLAIFTWVLGAIIASIAAYFIFYINGALYVFTGVVTGGTIGPMLAYYYFKKTTVKLLESLSQEIKFSGDFFNGRAVLNIRTKLLIAFIILLIESLGLSGLLNYEKLSVFLQKRNSEYALKELERIVDLAGAESGLSEAADLVQRDLSEKKKAWYIGFVDRAGKSLDGHRKIDLLGKEREIIKVASGPGYILRRSKDLVTYAPLKSGDGFAILYIPWSENNGEIMGLGRIFLLQTIITLFVYCFFAFLISDDVSSYIKKMSLSAEGISKGDLNQSIPVPTEDEVGLLAASLRLMSENLKGIIKKIERSSSNVNDAIQSIIRSYEFVSQGSTTQKDLVARAYKSLQQFRETVTGLVESTDIVSRSLDESTKSVLALTNAVQDISRRITFVSDSLNQVASSTEGMSSSIVEVSKNIDYLSGSTEKVASAVNQIDSSVKMIESDAKEGKTFSERVKIDALSGAETVQESIKGIKRIEEGSFQVSEAINTLKKRTDEITKILEVIDDITEETNLLALNAAIIAAQAGEHGKGFSVVADEIRGLAERTFNSTKEIADIIKKANDDAKRAILIMNEQRERIVSGVEVSMKSGDVLNKILNSSVIASEKMSNIAKATSELSLVSIEVSKEISKTADAIRKSSDALKTQARNSELIVKHVGNIKDAILEVKNSIKEQEKGSSVIAKNIQSIEELIQFLIKSVKEQEEMSKLILKDMENIKDISVSNEERAADLRDVIKVLSEESGLLEQEVKRFKI